MLFIWCVYDSSASKCLDNCLIASGKQHRCVSTMWKGCGTQYDSILVHIGREDCTPVAIK